MRKTIMIAANDPNILYLLQRYGEETGFDVVKTGHGKEVPDLAEQVKPALILLELDLLGITGRSTLRQLQDRETTRSIPIVIYSHSDEGTWDRLEGPAASLCEAVMYDDFLAALRQAGVYP